MREQLQTNTARGAQISKPPLLRIYSSQCIVLACLSAGLLLVDTTTAYSALLGGLISLVPNIYFATLAFRYSGARAASDVAKSLYKGEVGKFVLTAVMFASIFVLVKPLLVPTLFVSFILTMVLNAILVLRMSKF